MPEYHPSTTTKKKYIYPSCIYIYIFIELDKIFNKNTVKVSYSCTESVANTIKGHNNKLRNTEVRKQRACNCRVKSDCPLNGNCRKEGIVYKCTA